MDKKKKICVVIIILLVISILAIGVYAITNQKTEDIEFANEEIIVKTEENDLQEGNNIIDDEIENMDNESEIENITNEETQEEISTQPIQETTKESSSNSTITSQATSSSSEFIVEQTESSSVQSQETTSTPSDLSYWCVEGGTHHVAGDGANEHGYYNSWNEAQQAFEEYTKDWSSYQYKIDTCACGLYYFWAIQ